MDERQVALVTGGASGIGRATVGRFLTAGWCVVACDANAVSVKDLVATFPEYADNGQLVAVNGDISVEADVVQAIHTAIERFGRLDSVVNNAGVGGAFGPVTEIEVDDWDYTFAVLVRGVFLGIKHGARVMKDQTFGGNIVNVASVAGLVGDAGPQAYSVAKASVVHMSKVFATELAPFRIRVNAVCPGIVATPLNPATQPDSVSKVLSSQPWPDIGQPEDVAEAIYFLASEQAQFITGEAIAVDGGLAAAGPRVGTQLGLNSRALGVVGVNRGTTGRKATVHRKVDEASPTR
ncbi:MAG: glucose 1-dehydrogenase [Hyphomicrobiales bacterium]|nr:MAG: glucose 1-dehydrogenase [Hyphomicrobiales bacterium]